jgi:hypothetical protein
MYYVAATAAAAAAAVEVQQCLSVRQRPTVWQLPFRYAVSKKGPGMESDRSNSLRSTTPEELIIS